MNKNTDDDFISAQLDDDPPLHLDEDELADAVILHALMTRPT